MHRHVIAPTEIWFFFSRAAGVAFVKIQSSVPSFPHGDMGMLLSHLPKILKAPALSVIRRKHRCRRTCNITCKLRKVKYRSNCGALIKVNRRKIVSSPLMSFV